jgi:hypothetical protein
MVRHWMNVTDKSTCCTSEASCRLALISIQEYQNSGSQHDNTRAKHLIRYLVLWLAHFRTSESSPGSDFFHSRDQIYDNNTYLSRYRDSSVAYGWVTGWMLGGGVRVRAETWNVSLHHRFQTVSGAYPASYSMGTRGSFPGVKRPGREANHSPPSTAEVKNAWSYTSTLPICLQGVVLS